MTFEAVAILIIGLVVLFGLWTAARAIRTGTIGFGKRKFDRLTQPVEYWFYLLAMLGLLPTYFAFLLYAHLNGVDADILGKGILLDVVVAFWLVRGLQTGTTGMGDLNLERRHDPGLYWTFIGLMCAFLLFDAYRMWPAGS